MSETVYRRTVTIVNAQGLHLRPAHMLAEMASQFDSRIEVVKDDIRIDGKSVLSILTLGATAGSEVSVEGDGPDAQAAVESLVALITSGFQLSSDGEPPVEAAT